MGDVVVFHSFRCNLRRRVVDSFRFCIELRWGKRGNDHFDRADSNNPRKRTLFRRPHRIGHSPNDRRARLPLAPEETFLA